MSQYSQFEEVRYGVKEDNDIHSFRPDYIGETPRNQEDAASSSRSHFDEYATSIPAQKITQPSRHVSPATIWRLALALISVFAVVSLAHGILGDLSDAINASPFLIISRLIGLLLMGIVIIVINLVFNTRS